MPHPVECTPLAAPLLLVLSSFYLLNFVKEHLDPGMCEKAPEEAERFLAVFRRHLAPLTEARLAMLDEVEAAADGGPLILEAILEAHIRPAVVRALEPAYDNEIFSLLMGRCLSEPDIYAKYVHSHFKPVIERFSAAVATAVPGLSREEIFWRMSFMSGGLHLTIQMWSKPEIMVFEVGKPMDAERFIRDIIAFAAAGL